MPNHHCCVPGCHADSRKDTSQDKYRFLRGVTFLPFPRDPDTRQLWLELIKRNDEYVPNRYSRVCSLHFVGKNGPTPQNPCPTIFAYNNFTGKISEDLEPRVLRLSARARAKDALRVPQLGNVGRPIISSDMISQQRKVEVMSAHCPEGMEVRRPVMIDVAAMRRQKQEELNRVQAEIVAKAAANAQLLASINEAERSGQIQLIDEADIKAIQEAAQGDIKVISQSAGAKTNDANDVNNPYHFINENTDFMWQMSTLPKDEQNQGQVIKKVEGTDGNWEVLPAGSAKSKTASSPTIPSRKKRKFEEVDLEGIEDEEEDDDDESSSEEDEEEEDSGDQTSELDQKKETPKKQEPEPECIVAVPADPEALEEELNEVMLRPPLFAETPEVSHLRERLTVRGPHHNYLPKPRCKFCNLFFQSIESLLGHLYRHTDRPYQCIECGATFRKAEELETHIDVHLHREAEISYYYRVRGTKHGILECPVECCSWHSYSGIRVFAAHIREHNKGCCILCGDGIHGGSEPYYMKHVKKHMAWTTRIKCPLCPNDKQGVQRKFLEMHVKQQHATQTKPWACYHCDNHKIIPRFCDLDLHLLKTHSSNPYECQYCGAAYPSLYGLRCHARKHHKRGSEHDTKYEWVEVVHNQHANKETKLPATRKSNTRQKVNMMPQTGDRQMQTNQPQMSSVLSLFTSPTTQPKVHSIAALAAQAAAASTTSPTKITIPQVKQSAIQGMPVGKLPPGLSHIIPSIPGAAATKTSPDIVTGTSPSQLMRRYRSQKVSVMQKDGTVIKKTVLLPVDEPPMQAASMPHANKMVVPVSPAGGKVVPKPNVIKVPVGMKFPPPGSNIRFMSPDGVQLSAPKFMKGGMGIPPGFKLVQQQQPKQQPSSSSSSSSSPSTLKPPSTTSKPPASTNASSSSQQLWLADLAAGNIPGGLDIVDESILESLGISSQDLELGQPSKETDENLGFTITEVRGEIDFGALPDDGNDQVDDDLEAITATPTAPSLAEDKSDKALMKVRCPYKACTETFDTAIGFWRRHYLKLHFKRSDLYEFMCRDCGELFANWDWPPEGHGCSTPRWASICADCGDVFENQRFKQAHFPDCITFQRYTPAKAATVITERTCLYCHTTQKSVGDLCSHLRIAHVSRRFNSLSLFCSRCPDFPTFPKPDALWNHYKAKHLEWWRKQPAWVCTKCGETHESEYELTKHAVYTHAQEVMPSFLCGKCPYVFGQRTLYDMHKQIAHKD